MYKKVRATSNAYAPVTDTTPRSFFFSNAHAYKAICYRYSCGDATPRTKLKNTPTLSRARGENSRFWDTEKGSRYLNHNRRGRVLETVIAPSLTPPSDFGVNAGQSKRASAKLRIILQFSEVVTDGGYQERNTNLLT
ncbi:hypothetical protein EVAR_35944_1 [Eumeta japonica]|uniref:Uncharacterized protein n=1 Tax=Eumeta variegata TaxID=151549 RepID=A0A4C1W2E4_EUMVA|nr:hypothetical protein EVAR_35944_1 [Eumeta japonica]